MSGRGCRVKDSAGEDSAPTVCHEGDVNITIDVRADNYPSDTSWELLSADGNRLLHQDEGTFAKQEHKVSEICVPHGNYTFVIHDAYGNGLCCLEGEGYFRVRLDGREVLNGGSFNKRVQARLNVGYEPDGHMTARERAYLAAHNVRRRAWHEAHNRTHVPLRYSPGLARQSRAWAEALLDSCAVKGIAHEERVAYGENLAKNRGDAGTMGQLYAPDKIVGRWVDREVGWPYPSNGHLTQALWRASKYVGCGESAKPFRGGFCRLQVSCHAALAKSGAAIFGLILVTWQYSRHRFRDRCVGTGGLGTG